ncbi:MAG TPA: NAD(P)/FAD-dependent oxidoreductase [Longimicrobiales bacterium]|nr:NAD(P)/FAD-dependent oxidoreductase [Longimicrobiales bacterium]
MPEPKPHVVIIGGGFGGLYCARALKRAPVRITIVDRRNFHLFQPLLYQVATASLSPADIAHPIRSVLKRQRNAEVWMAEVSDIDVHGRTVQLDHSALQYDYLVVASGATHAYFGHGDWEHHAPGLKTIDDATEIRRRFLLAFEAAEREADPAARRRQLTFVIVGAGPTGVELAGAMAEIARQVMPQEFRAIDTTTTRILLLEGGPRVLPAYPAVLSTKAQRQLERLGVEVRTSAMVSKIEHDAVTVAGERIEAANVFWAAGVAASPLGARLGAPLDRAGRVLVERDCSIPGQPNVFVVGDLAHVEQDGKPVPGVAQGAMQMGTHAARCIAADLAGKPRKEFRYLDKGNLATIGRAAAVAEIGPLKFSGLPAWLIWVFVHIMYLIGFRNRIIVMLQWAWAYITYQRGVRLITGDVEVHLSRARV